MSERGDGGPAFPESGARGAACGGEGMSLRDWFAGQALAGLLASRKVAHPPDAFAVDAYACADALLAARTTTPPGGSP